MGELHPLAARRYTLPDTPVLAAELNVQALLAAMPERFTVEPVSAYPPVLEDIAVVIDEEVPAARVEAVIRQAGGQLLQEVRLFDTYRGAQIGEGKKSLAYSLTYQAPDRTLTDGEAAQVRQRVVRRLEQELGAKLRS
jgi:phenylalanyl-tRNA synthetase beta chain